ncbi:MAG: hypothetical protein ABFR97_05005 [Thermodesulfobacteriota bacterium]
MAETEGGAAGEALCEQCGRTFPTADITGTGGSWLCPWCLAEAESCGCSDD